MAAYLHNKTFLSQIYDGDVKTRFGLFYLFSYLLPYSLRFCKYLVNSLTFIYFTLEHRIYTKDLH